MRYLYSIITLSLFMAVSGLAQDSDSSIRDRHHPVIVKRIILKNQTAPLGPPLLGITFFTPEHEGVYRVTCGIQLATAGEAQLLTNALEISIFQTASVLAGTYNQILGSYVAPGGGPSGGSGGGGSFSFLGSPETTFTFSATTNPGLAYDIYIIVEEL